jgi:addiction module HigA family antidote
MAFTEIGEGLLCETVEPASLGIALDLLIEARGIERLEPFAEFCELAGRQFGDSLFEVFDGHAKTYTIEPPNTERTHMPAVSHPGRLLRRELAARSLSANRLSLDIGVPSGRITDILNGRRSITADTAVRLGRYFGNSAQFWLELQSQYDIAVVEREKGREITRRVKPADAA